MEKYYSNINPAKLLHIVVREDDFIAGRQDIISPNNFLQCATLNLDAGKTFKPHKHIFKRECGNKIAQESWIVLKGSVRCMFYDTDDTLIASPVLRAGDASFTLQGGHNYEILEDGSRILEMKTGPYTGQQNDKVFINQ